jgi:hypothetical protein
MRIAITRRAHAYAFGGGTTAHARLTPKLALFTLSIQTIVSLNVLVTIVRTITIAIAHKATIDASTRRHTLEHVAGACVVSGGARIRRLVLASTAITIAIAKPRVRYASKVNGI